MKQKLKFGVYCPHSRCFRKKPIDNYACYYHWMILPKKIRDKIWKGYRQKDYLKSGSLWHEANKEAKVFWKSK